MKEEILVDPSWDVPLGIKGTKVDDSQRVYELTPGGETPTEETSEGEGTFDPLSPPGEITIVQQTVRVGSDGRSVVDVIIEIDDQYAGSTIDTRLTKV